MSSKAWTRVLLLAAMAVALTTLRAPDAEAARRAGHASARRTAHAGRPGARRPRRPGPARRTRAVPWLKGNLPNVQAQGAYVLDLALGHELYARRPDEPRPIASISKLAATLVVVDRGLDLDRATTITRSDVDVARGGARSRLLEGMSLSNRDLLHAALLGSDNRAVPALGRSVGLDAAQLATAMTAKVRALGLKNTRFVEPTGLSPENVSTPRELIDLLRAVVDHPVLGPITQRLEYDAHPVGRAPIRYFNTHRAASRANTFVIGGKTGFNNAARYCLVLAARVAGRTIAMSFLGTEGELTRFGDVARVADWVAMQEAKESPRRMLASGPQPTSPNGLSVPASAAVAAAPVGGSSAPLQPLPPLAPLPGLTVDVARPAAPGLPVLTVPSLSPAAAPPTPATLTPPPISPPPLPIASAGVSEGPSSPLSPQAPRAPQAPQPPLPSAGDGAAASRR